MDHVNINWIDQSQKIDLYINCLGIVLVDTDGNVICERGCYGIETLCIKQTFLINLQGNAFGIMLDKVILDVIEPVRLYWSQQVGSWHNFEI